MRYLRGGVTFVCFAVAVSITRRLVPEWFPDLTNLSPELKIGCLLAAAAITALFSATMKSVKTEHFHLLRQLQSNLISIPVKNAVKNAVDVLEFFYNGACFSEFYQILTVVCLGKAFMILFEWA